jgi:hypothetical protein
VIFDPVEPAGDLCPAPEPATRRRRGGRLVLLAVAVIATSWLTLLVHHAELEVALITVAGAACAALTVLERRAPELPVRVIAVAIGIVITAAVIMPSRASKDLWSYAMYGRMVAVHHVSPYDHVPAEFPADPFSTLVSARWSHQQSVYGPAFSAAAAIEVTIAGDSTLASRLMFQGTAAAAVVATFVLVWRRTRSTVALLWLGLNPVTAVVVNGGHNDAVVALGLVAAAALLGRRRIAGAGVVLGLAALFKVTALFGVVGACFWLFRSGRRRDAGTLLLTSAGVVVLGYLPVFTSATRVLGSANRTITDASAWNPLGEALLGHQAWRDVPHPLAPNSTLAAISVVAGVVVVALVVVLGWRAATAPDPEPPIGTSVACYQMAAAYTFPWYSIWALPLFASKRPSAVGWIVWIQSLVILAALKLPNHPTSSVAEAVDRFVLTIVAPLALIVAFVVVAARARRPAGTPAMAPA